MVGAKVLRIPVVILIVDGMTLHAGASGPVSAIKMSAIFLARGDSAGDGDPPAAGDGAPAGAEPSRAALPDPDPAVSPEMDDGGAPDPGLNGSMADIGSFFCKGDPAPGITLTRAESDTAPTEKLSDQAGFHGQVRRASRSGHPGLEGAVLDDRVEELRIRGTDSHTRTWMASRGG